MNWLRIDALEEEVGMDISRHKGPAYESEGSASQRAIMQLSTRRLECMDNSHSSRGKSFRREKPAESPEKPVESPEKPEAEATTAEAGDAKV